MKWHRSIAATFLGLAVVSLDSRPAVAQLALDEGSGRMAVTSSSGPGWRISLDLAQGGVATELRIPADGPNLAAPDGGFAGLFNLFARDSRVGDPRAIA